MSKNIWENVSNIKKGIFSTYNDQKQFKEWWVSEWKLNQIRNKGLMN